MTNTEIEQYLKRNDVIFIPVGTVEPHAELPIDAEYVGPLAVAMMFFSSSAVASTMRRCILRPSALGSRHLKHQTSGPRLRL
jgi:hypothetical protein